MYESPQADMGYDISDYQKVDPQYGTLEDWEQVKDACHERGMKLVMDLVVNHSSDQVSLSYRGFEASLTISTPGSRRAGSPKIAQRGTGTSGTMARPTTRARGSHPTTGGPSSERKPFVACTSSISVLTFSGPAWTFDEGSQQWYCHTFLKEQPGQSQSSFPRPLLIPRPELEEP